MKILGGGTKVEKYVCNICSLLDPAKSKADVLPPR